MIDDITVTRQDLLRHLAAERELADDLAAELDHYFGHVPGLDKRVDAVLARYREARK